MPENLNTTDWDSTRDEPGFSWKRRMIARQLGGKDLGASLYELPVGERLFPYHLHHGNEELLIVLEGEPTLRTPDGETELRAGDVELFPTGPAGAHQVKNNSDGTVRLLMISTMTSPEVVEYPDSEKVGALAWPPGGSRDDAFVAFFPKASEVGYFDGET
ncbi:MAG: cupin domain-containing protein [Gaiellaceae bacterium]